MSTNVANSTDSNSPTKVSQPQFSIIVAVKNGAETLNRCLESITSQTYDPKELIVMDGGSNDGTLPIIRAYQNKITYWESGSDRGIYHAWNKSLNHARGEWICFLGADDFFWDAQVLSNLASYLETATVHGVKIVYGRVVKLDDQGRQVRVLGRSWSNIRWSMPHGMPLHLPHPGLMHHRSLFEDFGIFDETFKIAGDYEFLLRAFNDLKALFVEDLLILGSQIGGIADASGIRTNMETARARKKHGLKRFSWVWTAIFIRACARKLWHEIKRKYHKP